MVTTRRLSDTIARELQTEPAFRQAFLAEAINCMIAGDIEGFKLMLVEFIHGTVGFSGLAQAVSQTPDALLAMMAPEGVLPLGISFDIVAHLQKLEGTEFRVENVKAAA